MLLSYNKQDAREEQKRTQQLMVNSLKIKFYMRLLRMHKVHKYTGSHEDNEYLISNIAIYPQFQNCGLGTLLLQEAEKEAIQKGNTKLALEVEISNTKAARFYKGINFIVKERHPAFRLGKKSFKFLKGCKTPPNCFKY